MASPLTAEAAHLTATMVEIVPGGKQRIHSHGPEQIYYILEGVGRMTVAGETAEVCSGNCVFVPSNAPHGIENHSDTVLKYFSAASPSFDAEQLKAWWPLQSESESDDQ